MNYFSTFSGIGGFELALAQAYESLCDVDGSQNGRKQTDSSNNERQGLLATQREKVSASKRPVSKCTSDITHKRPLCVGFSEIDKYATQIYQQHYPTHTNYGDITHIDAATLPDFELFVGGFPCQSFSIAGKRRGFEDTRGTLFFEIARIVKQKQPRLLLLENVKGLLSHDHGHTFAVIISALDDLGYDCQWQVLNSKNFGIPQNRERIFIVGHLRGTPRPEVFPITDGSPSDIAQLNDARHSNSRIYGTEGISPTLNTAQGGNRQPFITNPKMMNHKKDYENSVAITATSYKEPPVVSGIRRLTPTECERLQGFPDGWTEGVSDTQRYKCLGNAVTVNTVQAIIEKLL